MGFLVPRIYEEAGGGGGAAIPGVLVCVGVVTDVFERANVREKAFEGIERLKGEIHCRRARVAIVMNE
jgi:hypothetical protein